MPQLPSHLSTCLSTHRCGRRRLRLLLVIWNVARQAAPAGRPAILLDEFCLDEPMDLFEELVYVIDGSGGESMFTGTVLLGIDGLTAPHIVLASVFGPRLQIGQRSGQRPQHVQTSDMP